MNLVGLLPVRNEAWIVGLSARAALLWVDRLIVLNHASIDETGAVLADLQAEVGDRLVVIEEAGTKWDEMAHRQRMLVEARKLGATHIAIIDADEILTGNLLPLIRSRVEGCGSSMVQLPGYNLRGSIDRYHSNGIWGSRWFSAAFADDSRLAWEGDRFHAREPQGRVMPAWRPFDQGKGGVMHLWGSNERRLIAKHRMYRIQEALRWPNKPRQQIEAMYSLATEGKPPSDTPAYWTYAAVPESWWAPYSHLMKYLDLEAEPWQEAWCAEMIAQYGIERFTGLKVA